MGWARGYPLYLPPPPRPKHYAPHRGICLGRRGGGRRPRAVDGGGAVAERAWWGSVGTFPRARQPHPAPPACAPPACPRALARPATPSCSSARAPPPRPASVLPRARAPSRPARVLPRARAPAPPRPRAPARARLPPRPASVLPRARAPSRPARALLRARPCLRPIHHPLIVKVHVEWSVCCNFFSGS